MSIRQTSGDPHGVVSGYEGNNVATDFYIPPCTIEDVEYALFELFNEKIGYWLTVNKESKKVPVIFATGERFALLNRNKPVRDRNGALILPVITIRRTSIEQTSKDLTGRGINQHTGDLVIKRRLSPNDPSYQQLINKLNIQNQSNIALSTITNDPDPIGNRESIGGLKDEPHVVDGGWLRPDFSNNIFEFITIPQPQFFTGVYEVSFWVQYIQHMNYLIERTMNSYLPQGRSFKLETKKGYWFVANFPDVIPSGDNFEDFTGNERIIKTTFTVRVPAYLVAPDEAGNMSPFRRLVSAPRVSFEMEEQPGEFAQENPDLSADDPNNAFTLTGDVEFANNGQFSDKNSQVKDIVVNPFTGEKKITYIRLLKRNQRVGETVYSAKEIKGLGDI